MKRYVCLVLLCLATIARAQTPVPVAPPPASPVPAATLEPPPSPDDGTLHPTRADRATCLLLDTTPGALIETAPTSDQLATPIPWADFAIDGRFIAGDTKDTLHAIFEPTFNEHRTNFTAATWRPIAALAAKFGYQVVGHVVVDTPQGARLSLSVAPLPLVRKVYTNVSAGGFFLGLGDKLLDEDVGRRLRVRPGSYLPWEPIRRQCSMADERDRIEAYLHDEGYADATVQIDTAFEDIASVQIKVHVVLGTKYVTGLVRVINASPSEALAISPTQIANEFHHRDNCLLFGCISSARFTRSKMQDDLASVRSAFHQRGYLTARVTSSFEPQISFDRRTHTVNFTITVDQRRFADVKFEGTDISSDELKSQLTFAAAGSTDDVEIQTSAGALVAFLQARGFFEARVTWDRQRLSNADLITFHVDAGPSREVASVTFTGAKVIPVAKLAETVTTKEAGLRSSFFGTNAAATAATLERDAESLVALYRREGYREAKVAVSASPVPAALGDVALTAAMVLADRGRDLHVRFAIEEGEATLLSHIAVDIQAEPTKQAELCTMVLKELASELGERQFAKLDGAMSESCAATAAKFAYREDDVAVTREHLRDFFLRLGRRRALVELEIETLGPHRIGARYKVRALDEVRIGKAVIRGNFKTREWVIRKLLDLPEGALLTSDGLAEGARRLRNTGLFDAVSIELPDLCGASATSQTCTSGSAIVNGVVRVEERYDQLADVSLFGGYSSYNGLYGGAGFAMRNLAGLGLVWTASLTVGTKITDLESTFQVPKWLVQDYSPIAFRTDLTGLYRQQDTPRFGLLTTVGLSVSLTTQDSRPRTATQSARVRTWNLLRYDFRLRTREVDAIRPIGTNQDSAQVAVSTRTSSIGMAGDWDQRVDRDGQLSPLAPSDGFRLEGSVSYAERFLFGQDTFIKISASGSKFIPVGDNLVLRGDLRVDWGIPLGGSVLLPEVERFFAGGDSTVRGYSDDRMATELIQVGVPPIGGNLTQIRIIPAGGNIRAIGSLDAQLRIWKVLAGALFTDAGAITNTVGSTKLDDFRPSVGMGLRVLTPFGVGAVEYAVPLRPQLGDDPRGRIHVYFAARAQF